MKEVFGNRLTRILHGGTTLTALEKAIFKQLVERLPPVIRQPLFVQLDGYNLVQREIDGRALNFYRKMSKWSTREGLPELPLKEGEVPLLKMTFSINGQQRPFHASITAVNRRFFCLNFSSDLRPFSMVDEITLGTIVDSWRSGLIEE